MTLPAISPHIWGVFERAGLSPLHVLAAEPSELVTVARADIDTVEVMQGRVSKWLNSFIAQAEPLLLTRDA